MSTPLPCFNIFTSTTRHAWNTDENGEPYLLSGDKGRAEDEEASLCISRLTSGESDSTAIANMFHSEMNEQGQALEVDAREMDKKRKAIEEAEIRKREEQENESENARLEAEEYLKEEVQRFEEEEEQRIREEEENNFYDSASPDGQSLKGALQHLDEKYQIKEEAGDAIISPGVSSDSKPSESTSGSVTIDQLQIEQSEDSIHEKCGDEENVNVEENEYEPKATTTDRPALEAVSGRGFDTMPYHFRDLFHKIQKTEQRLREFEEELEEARNMSNGIARLETADGNVKGNKKGKSDNTNMDVSDSTSLSDDDSDEVVEAEREDCDYSDDSEDSDEQTNEEEEANNDGVEKQEGALNKNIDLSGRTSDELDRNGSGENSTLCISLAPPSSSDGNSTSTASRLNLDSKANKNTNGTDICNSDSDSGAQSTHNIDKRERKGVDDSKTFQRRLEGLEACVRKLDESSCDETLFEEILRRLSTIEDNQKSSDEDTEKGHRLEMENIQALFQQIESSQKMQLSVPQKFVSSITPVSRNHPKQIPPTLSAEELTTAIRQASASASASSRDAALYARAARQAAIAAKSAADAHGALLHKSSSNDGNDGNYLKKNQFVYFDEIEKAIMDHPSVKTARAFGIPDRRYGVECCCVVDLKIGARVSEPWLTFHAENSLPPECVPKLFFYKDGLKRDEDGKSFVTDKRLKIISEAIGTGNTKKNWFRIPPWVRRFWEKLRTAV